MPITTCFSERANGTELTELIDMVFDLRLPVGDVGVGGGDSSGKKQKVVLCVQMLVLYLLNCNLLRWKPVVVPSLVAPKMLDRLTLLM